jgi:ATP/ADP translocase
MNMYSAVIVLGSSFVTLVKDTFCVGVMLPTEVAFALHFTITPLFILAYMTPMVATKIGRSSRDRGTTLLQA